jgi:hypothetical protein
MFRLIFGASIFWALLFVVVYVRSFYELGVDAVNATPPNWLWLPYSAASLAFDAPLRPEDKATLIAAVGGAILGGLISWAIARQTASDARTAAKETHLQNEKSKALKAVIKIAQLSNSIYTIHRNIEDSIQSARDEGDYRIAIWPLMRPSAHIHVEASFDADDLTPFTFAGKSNIIQEIIMLCSRHNSLSQAFSIYSQKRSEFQEFAEPYSRLDHMSGQHTTIFEGEAAIRAAVKTFELDSLSRDIRRSASEYNEHAKSTCTLVDSYTQKRYGGSGGFIKLELIDHDEPVADGLPSPRGP